MDRILVCLAMGDGPGAVRIRQALERNGHWDVRDVSAVECHDDFGQCCPEIVVMDTATFDSVPLPLDHPERVVLMARKDRTGLGRAWDAGIISVVWDTDSIETIFLAIQAAALRCRPSPSCSPSAPTAR